MNRLPRVCCRSWMDCVWHKIGMQDHLGGPGSSFTTVPFRGVASPDCPGGQSWWASRWRVSANCALARTGGCLRGDVPPSEAGRFWNFDTEFTQFSDNFYAKFIPLEMFKYTPFSIFFLFSSLSSPFSSPLFFPFPLSSLLFSFPFLFLFFFPFSFSLSFSLSLFFLPFSLPFPLLSFLSPFLFSFPIFGVRGAVCPPCPPIGYASGSVDFLISDFINIYSVLQISYQSIIR